MTIPNLDWIEKYQGRPLIIDTNILLLHFIGLHDRELISRFKRTAQFRTEDFDLLQRLLSLFSSILTMPNILTEVGNLAAQLGEPLRGEFFQSFANTISLIEERYISSAELSRLTGFARFGLTDMAVEQLASEGFLVLTDDFRLSQWLMTRGLPVLNFNHIRTLGWK